MTDKKIIALLAVALVVAVVGAKMILDNRQSDTTPKVDSNRVETASEVDIREQYPQLPKDNTIIRESAREVIDRLKGGDGIVFLGFKECPWCQKLLPIVDEAATAEGVKVYYLDIRKLREDNTAEYRELATILAPFLPKDEKGDVRIMVPDVSFVRNGEIIDRHEMESVTDEEKTPDAYWTEERKLRAVERFKQMISQMKQLSKEKEEL